MPKPLSSVTVSASSDNPITYTSYALTILQDVISGGAATGYPFIRPDTTTVLLPIIRGNAKDVRDIANRTLDKTSKDECKKFLTNKDLVVAIDPATKRKYSIGDLQKPPSSSINFGYVAEVILQCAITARLIHRKDTITVYHISEKLRDYLGLSRKAAGSWPGKSKSNMVTRKIKYKADNYSIRQQDDVVTYMATMTSTYDYLKARAEKRDITKDSLLKSFFDDALAYVNSSRVKDHAEYFYKNGLVDLLEIKASGVFGQVGSAKTKADVVTSYREGYDGKNENSGTPSEFSLNLSIKSRHQKQFGQATGAHADAMELFASAVGVTLDPITLEKIKTLVPRTAPTKKTSSPTQDNEEDITKAFFQVQELVYDEMYHKLHNARGAAIGKLFDGIEYFMALRDPTIVVVDIGSGLKTYYVSRFEDLKKRLANGTITCKLAGKQSGNHRLDVYVNDGPVVTLESIIKEGLTCRNYVKFGPDSKTNPGLRAWLSELQ